MESVINEMAEKFKANLREFFMREKRSLAEAERYFGECLSHIVIGLLSAYYEKLDREILEDKAERRKKGLSAERHGDKRTILTTLGEVEYDRTYYRTKEKEYCYPVDAVAGVESRQRLAAGVNEELVRNACAMSYTEDDVFDVTFDYECHETKYKSVKADDMEVTYDSWKLQVKNQGNDTIRDCYCSIVFLDEYRRLISVKNYVFNKIPVGEFKQGNLSAPSSCSTAEVYVRAIYEA